MVTALYEHGLAMLADRSIIKAGQPEELRTYPSPLVGSYGIRMLLLAGN